MTEALRIMLVEDELALRLVVTVALEKIGGFVVKSCATGEEALEQVEQFRPNVFLLDVMMPHLDGPATLARLRELPDHRQTPAIFLTAKVQSREIEDLMGRGAIGVLSKPFDPMLLSRSLTDMLRNCSGAPSI